MELSTLIEAAGTAPRERRIEWRDRIAAYGARAIESIRPWLADPARAAFAIRVIERAGSNGEADLAARVLRSARSRMSPVLRGDVDWALGRLRARSQVLAKARRATHPPRLRDSPALPTVDDGGSELIPPSHLIDE